MSEETIKEVILALINNKYVYGANDNEDIAKEIAIIYNTLKKETSN